VASHDDHGRPGSPGQIGNRASGVHSPDKHRAALARLEMLAKERSSGSAWFSDPSIFINDQKKSGIAKLQRFIAYLKEYSLY